MARITPASLYEAQSFATAYMLPDARVAGVGSTTLAASKYEKVNVYVAQEKDMWEVRGEVGGYETRPVFTGKIRKLAHLPDSAFMSHYRPSPGGVSIGPQDGSAGTFGITVFEKKTGKRYILTNSHVAAGGGVAPIGSEIYQPALIDGGNRGQDMIGRLARHVRLYQNGLATPYVNQVDAALVEPTVSEQILDEILDMPQEVNEAIPPTVGRRAMISSRNGKRTGGVIIDNRATFKIAGYPQEIALNPTGELTFYNCVILEPSLTAPGSSGGVFVDEIDTSKALGLNFAGSEQVSIANWITSALELTNTTLEKEFVTGTDNLQELPAGMVIPQTDHEPPVIPDPTTTVGDYIWNTYLKPVLPIVGIAAAGGFFLWALTK